MNDTWNIHGRYFRLSVIYGQLKYRQIYRKYSSEIKDNHHFTCCFVWVWKLVCHTKGENRLRMCENRVQVKGGWRRMHNEELRNLCTSSNIIIVIKWRRMRWAGHAAHMGETRNIIYTILTGKPERKRLCVRHRSRILLEWILDK
jgi:hypothetical protein